MQGYEGSLSLSLSHLDIHVIKLSKVSPDNLVGVNKDDSLHSKGEQDVKEEDPAGEMTG